MLTISLTRYLELILLHTLVFHDYDRVWTGIRLHALEEIRDEVGEGQRIKRPFNHFAPQDATEG